eukprot:TRINITY_DN1919_c0_g2_i3.p1 TRINITY_DN1919_c0_g2~~TRINITY_DN1919_c0_g2_i3.p1  ORF type:complete len:452 (-),score=50.88 TRINITY_DN1919_c0_g2_i3:113-1420(-)
MYVNSITEIGNEQWHDLNTLLSRAGNLTGPNFEPSPELLGLLQNYIKVLVVGAGGLGCELLKDLALSGFGNIHVIDMDTIELSNLNRQFLFREKDVGRSKAEVAAERVNQRIKTVSVTPHFARIEDKDINFYKQFHIIVLGLDSIEARKWMNELVLSILERDAEGNPVQGTIVPIVDGGTEGLKGHARVIYPGISPCFHCTLWLFPPQEKFPLCTLAETPRLPAHCIEYAHLVEWEQMRPDVTFDADDEEHVKWVFDRASERAKKYGIQSFTYQFTLGVVKNVIPAIASSNAIISAACALETLKIATVLSQGMDNYMMYVGTEAVYTYTVKYERDEACPICSGGIPTTLKSKSMTLQQVFDQLSNEEVVKEVTGVASSSNEPLYMLGPLEEFYKDNLVKTLQELIGDSRELLVMDKQFTNPVRFRVKFEDDMEQN